MKTLVLATSLFTFMHYGSEEMRYEGFYASAFYPAGVRYCFTGEALGACAKIKDAADYRYQLYLAGDHDYFKVASCESQAELVRTELRLFDDYGTDDLPFVATIPRCN